MCSAQAAPEVQAKVQSLYCHPLGTSEAPGDHALYAGQALAAARAVRCPSSGAAFQVLSPPLLTSVGAQEMCAGVRLRMMPSLLVSKQPYHHQAAHSTLHRPGPDLVACLRQAAASSRR